LKSKRKHKIYAPKCRSKQGQEKKQAGGSAKHKLLEPRTHESSKMTDKIDKDPRLGKKDALRAQRYGWEVNRANGDT
jgi:hypothetical protein